MAPHGGCGKTPLMSIDPNGGARPIHRDPRDFSTDAADFDRRAGLGDPVASKVADAVVQWAQPKPADVILEIGAGTGEIGTHLVRPPARYVALDASEAMLRRFPPRRETQASAVRIAADCNRAWPIADHTVCCVFASRVLHLLDDETVIANLKRVLTDRGCLLIGRTRRDPGGHKELLRERMHQALVHCGRQPRPGRERGVRLLDRLIEVGATPSQPVDVATWPTRGTAAEVLRAWSNKRDLGGLTVDGPTRDAVLAEVTKWAHQRFGDLDGMHESTETYTLTSVRWTT